MKKVLAINSGSSSFKYKLFSLPDEEVLAEGLADRVGLDDSTFSIKALQFYWQHNVLKFREHHTSEHDTFHTSHKEQNINNVLDLWFVT